MKDTVIQLWKRLT